MPKKKSGKSSSGIIQKIEALAIDGGASKRGKKASSAYSKIMNGGAVNLSMDGGLAKRVRRKKRK